MTLTTPLSETVGYPEANTKISLDSQYNRTKLASATPEIFKGVQNLKVVHVPLTTPLSGTVCHRQTWTSYGKPMPTKSEVSNFTRHGNMIGVAKGIKWGDFGGLGVTQSYRQCHHSIDRIRLPIRL